MNYNNHAFRYNNFTKLCKFLSALIIIGAFYHYIFVIRPYILELKFNMGSRPLSALAPADLIVYFNYANFKELQKIPLNIFGPVLFLKLFFLNPDVCFFINSTLLSSALYFFAKTYKKNFFYIFILFLGNPIIFLQIFFPNKEVYMLISSIFYLNHFKNKNKNFLIIAIIISLFSKIEFLAIVIVWFSIINLPSNRNKNILISFLILIPTIFYNQIPGMQGKVEMLNMFTKTSKGFTYYLQLAAADYYLFPIVAAVRNLLSISTGIINILRNNISLSSTIDAVSGFIIYYLFYISTFKRKFSIYSNENLFLLIFFISVATVPFSLHRYIIPCYPFLISLYFQKEGDMTPRAEEKQ